MMDGVTPLCSFCKEVPTRHRCMHPVRGGHVCGELICAPCSSSFGSEDGIFCCLEHSNADANKENEPGTAGEATVTHGKKKKTKVTSKLAKTLEYSSKDLLVLSQAFIHTSENAIEGAERKRNKFWDEVPVAFNSLKKQQESYDSSLQKKNCYNQVLLKDDFFSSDEEDENECIVPPRTASSLQQKWSKSVLPLVTKFIHMTNHNRYYNRVHLIFLEQNPAISFFELYCPAWEFLKDSAKFQSITVALKAAPHGNKHMIDELVDLDRINRDTCCYPCFSSDGNYKEGKEEKRRKKSLKK